MHHRQHATGSTANEHWWPDRLNLRILRQHPASADPNRGASSYAAELQSLDFEALAQDVDALMTDSKPWWPADWGHYGPFFMRLSWHAAGTYRIADGRGGGGSGAQRFAPLSSWPDNANLDKARRLLWPVKQKYGRKISWADLMLFVGNRALETMGLPTFGFGFGREDIYASHEDDYWGPETTWLGDERYSGDRDLAEPLGAVQMGLIYVNPEGPNGNPDPLAAARDIRETFSRMAMNDEETVALIAGGHTFGKCHGAAPDSNLGPAPEGAPLAQQGLGWRNAFGEGHGAATITGGPEGAWTDHPTSWDSGYLDNLIGYDWELSKSPAGAHQWRPKQSEAQHSVPDAHDPSKKVAPMMLTTDIALIVDPAYKKICEAFHGDPEAFGKAFARAWFKLLHRDMGPVSRYLGPWVPEEELLWQDPVPAVDHPLVDDADVAALEAKVLDCGLSIAQLVRTAWASACTYRDTDKRGGANGARLRLAPQRDWDVNVQSGVSDALGVLEGVARQFNDAQSDGKRISLADLVVLAGGAAIKAAAKKAGVHVVVPFAPGRTDASAEQTDADSFAPLEPRADAFRNYLQEELTTDGKLAPEHRLVDQACLLTLTVPEMTVLLGGLRVLGANAGDSKHGVFTDRPGTLTNDFFVHLLDLETEWTATSDDEQTFEGRDRKTGKVKWTATRVDLVFGSNAELRAVCEVYGADDARDKLVHDFVAAWVKVMQLDRFDLPPSA